MDILEKGFHIKEVFVGHFVFRKFIMQAINPGSKNLLKKAVNMLFFGLLLFFIFSTGAKSWVLQQLISVGLFKAEIKKDASAEEMLVQNNYFSFVKEDGVMQSTADLKGKVVFINFWATWCPPCRAEMPSLNDLYNKFKQDERFVFLFVNEDDDEQKAKKYLQGNKFAIPLTTRAGNIPASIFSGTLPTTIVLNKEGAVVVKHEGLAGYNTEDFIRQLKELL